MAAVLWIVAAQGVPAWQPQDRPGDPAALDDLDVDHSSSDALDGSEVVVALDQVHLAVGTCPAEAFKIDDLTAFHGGPAALVLPATYLHHHVHASNLTVCPGRPTPRPQGGTRGRPAPRRGG
ncbi:hypothetical protein NUM3379_36120 [Kineococcus sp. NUM-3379]